MNQIPTHPTPPFSVGLSHRQRIYLAAARGVPDQPPRGELVLDDGLIADFLGRDTVDFPARREFVERLGLDLVTVSLGNAERDAPAASPWRQIEQWRQESDRFVMVLIDGPFGQGVVRQGFMEFMVTIARGGAPLAAHLGDAVRMCLSQALAALDSGAQGIILADDIAHGQGLLTEPEFFRQKYFPALNTLLSTLRRREIPVFFHSDGQLEFLLPDLATAGFSGLQCLEPGAGMDLARLKPVCQGKLCLWGNLDPHWLVGEHPRQKVEAAARAVLAAGAPGGGFIFGTSSGLFRGMRPQNLAWAYAALDEGL